MSSFCSLDINDPKALPNLSSYTYSDLLMWLNIPTVEKNSDLKSQHKLMYKFGSEIHDKRRRNSMGSKPDKEKRVVCRRSSSVDLGNSRFFRRGPFFEQYPELFKQISDETTSNKMY